jgi:hypothetical protein
MNIRLSANEVRKRDKKVRGSLRPLVNNSSDIFVIPKSQSPTEFVLSAYGRGFPNAGRFDSLRFPTVTDDFFGMYYETWKRDFDGKKEFYYLYRSYLHLYDVSSGEETEFVLLHCDPNEPLGAAHAIYKRSIHVHIECGAAPHPHHIWPHSHIGLNVAYLSKMLSNEAEFSSALNAAVLMLREQVLDLL